MEARRSPTGFWDALSSPDPYRKMHPAMEPNSGMHFPLEPHWVPGVPLWSRILGCTFPDELKGESASRFETRFWDAVSPSGLSGKVRPILRVDSGTRFPERALWENASHSGRRPNAHITRP